jgi:hypothetical protein
MEQKKEDFDTIEEYMIAANEYMIQKNKEAEEAQNNA